MLQTRLQDLFSLALYSVYSKLTVGQYYMVSCGSDKGLKYYFFRDIKPNGFVTYF